LALQIFSKYSRSPSPFRICLYVHTLRNFPPKPILLVDRMPVSLYSVRVLKTEHPKLRKAEPCRVKKLKRSRYQDEPERPGITRGLQAFLSFHERSACRSLFLVPTQKHTSKQGLTEARKERKDEATRTFANFAAFCSTTNP
jgi:hypothetical protein